MYLKEATLLQGGKYRIVRHISSGGFGNTYEALDVNLDKKVAIKEFFVKDFCGRDTDDTTLKISVSAKEPLINHLKQKFIDEARAIAKMEHENIVKVQALFEENSTAYYVMDYVDGESLGAVLKRRGSLPEKEAVAIILKVASALDYMHKQNRFHLDVKPANIMLRKDGKVLLIDFGSSKQYAEVDGENTTTLAPCYTPGYAPSEQMNPKPTKFTAATDVYSLGATLYKMLTGMTPPSAIDIVNGEETLSPLSDEISKNVKECVAKAMIPQRNLRIQSIDDFICFMNSENVIEEDAYDIYQKAMYYQFETKEYEKAFNLFLQSAKLGYAAGMNTVGGLYEDGSVVPQDINKAIEWYTKAAEQGYPRAQYNLGLCYHQGKGVAEDYEKAAEWYAKAADQGHIDAQTNLAVCYMEGQGVKQNSNKAFELYMKAALQEDVNAMCCIGYLYENGEGVSADKNKAIEWYTKAAAKGDEYAKQALQILNEPPKGTLTVIWDGYWVLIDEKYELHYNGKHIADVSFKKPYTIELPIEQAKTQIRFKKFIFGVRCDTTLDPTKNYVCVISYQTYPKQFHMTIYDENKYIVYSD